MKIFLTGASGLVGAAVARAAERRGHAVTGTVGKFSGELEGVRKKIALDLADETAAMAAVLDAFPDAIVNCAALSSPDACEADPALAQAVNVALPAALARAAHHLSARLVHISSEQVFVGARREKYAVGDAPSPVNLYGRQKLASERAVGEAAAEFAAVVRAPLLTGNSPGGARTVHERLFADWAAGRTPRLYTDEFRQTCTAENLAEVLLELCERPELRGVFHWAGAELLSRHALAIRVRERFKLDEKNAPLTAVVRADTPEVSRKRPACLALDLAPLAGKLKTRPQTMEEQLDELVVPGPGRTWFLSQK